MAKIKTVQFEEQLIRYTIDSSMQLWFFSQDILMILPNTLTSVFDEDVKEISYEDTQKDFKRIMGVSIYGVFHLISLALLKPNRDKALKFKRALIKEILPRINKEENNPISEEDRVLLKIIHAETNTEKAYRIAEYNKLKSKAEKIEANKETVVRGPHTSDVNVFSIEEINGRFNFKVGQLTGWLREQGYFKYGGNCGKSPQVLYPGSELLVVKHRLNGENKIRLCVTTKGYELVSDKQDDIRKFKRLRK